MALNLKCTAGAFAGQELPVEFELIFGREMPEPGSCGGDPQLSRRHARVYVRAGGLEIEDLGSMNGTFVNGERLTGSRALIPGDEIGVGQTRFEVVDIVTSAATVLDVDTAAAGLGARLNVVEGPAAGSALALDEELLIGRSFGEPGALGGDRQLSRRHCRVARGPGGLYYVEDTGSSNGTFVNEELIRGARPLVDGDVLRVGVTKMEAAGMPRVELEPELPAEPDVAPGRPEREAAAGVAEQPALAGPAMFESQGEAEPRLSSRRLVTAFAAVFAAAAAIAVVIGAVVAPLGSRNCPDGFICHRPPTAPALRVLTAYTGQLGWKVEYDPQIATPDSSATTANQLVLHESNAIDAKAGLSQGAHLITIELQGLPAGKATTHDAIQSLAAVAGRSLVGAATAPSADQMFANPAIGLHPGQGEVLEGSQSTPQGPGPVIKVALLAATAGGVTMVAGVEYPIQSSQSQASNPDRPLDQIADSILNTIRLPGDGP